MIVDASVVLSALFPDEAQPQAQAVIRDGDLRLYNAVQSELSWVQWVGDYEVQPGE